MSCITNLISIEVGKGDINNVKMYIKKGYILIITHCSLLCLSTYFIRYYIGLLFSND